MTDWPYTYEILDVALLTVDETYQRPLSTLVSRIERKFDPALVGTLVVSRRDDGTHAVVDGQTRATAIRTLAEHGQAPAAVPCLIYRGLTRAQEASLFSRLQRERRGIASAHRFRAAVVAGEREAVAIEKMVNRIGYEIGAVPGQTVTAVAALEKVYRRGPDVLERTLKLLRRAWGKDYLPSGEMIRGLGYLLDTTPGLSDTLLIERIAAVTPAHLQRRASFLREGGTGHGGGSDKYMAGAIEAVYSLRPADDQRMSTTCKAQNCSLSAPPGEEHCDTHAEMAAALRRRLQEAA